MPLTDFDTVLFARAREYLRAGRLPSTVPESIWAGPGTGVKCNLCEEIIGPDQIEYEFEVAEWAVRLHIRCHALWQLAADERSSGR